MKKSILWMLLSCLACSMAAQDMKSVFISMPDSITPFLTKVNKEDCVDFLDSNMKAEVSTRLGGTAEMKVLTDDYVWMQTTPTSSLEMKLFPVNDSVKVVCMVKTVCASACDSHIRFYTSDWSKQFRTEDFLQAPTGESFFLPNDSLTDEALVVRKKADMHLLKASLSKDDASLTFIYTTPEYLNKEDREKLLPHLRQDPIILKWENGKFR